MTPVPKFTEWKLDRRIGVLYIRNFKYCEKIGMRTNQKISLLFIHSFILLISCKIVEDIMMLYEIYILMTVT